MDETYQIYVNRMARLTLPDAYQTQLANIQKSPKFEGTNAVSFPGYSVITPPWQDDRENSALYAHLEACQQELLQELGESFAPVPPASFHLTVADLIWDSGYRNAVKENPNFERQLQASIADSFEQYGKSDIPQSPDRWQVLGLILFPRALAVGLVPNSEETYERMSQLRRSIYQNPSVVALGIEQQYYFTAHITLGYFIQVPSDSERDRLASLLSTFNDRWLEMEAQVLTLDRVELRKFKDMTCFERESDYPFVQLQAF